MEELQTERHLEDARDDALLQREMTGKGINQCSYPGRGLDGKLCNMPTKPGIITTVTSSVLFMMSWEPDQFTTWGQNLLNSCNANGASDTRRARAVPSREDTAHQARQRCRYA